MAPSNALMIHVEEKLLPKEKNKVSRAPNRSGQTWSGLARAPCKALPLSNKNDTGKDEMRRGRCSWGIK